MTQVDEIYYGEVELALAEIRRRLNGQSNLAFELV